MVDQQPDVELGARELRARQRRPAPRAAPPAGDRVPTCRAHAPRGARRLSASAPRAQRGGREQNRSSAPDTCRQSSIAQSRSASSKPRPQTITSSNVRRRADTVRSATKRPVASLTAATVCERLCVSAPITIVSTIPSLGHTNGSPVDTSQSGRCHAPITSRRRSSDGGGRHNHRKSGPRAEHRANGSARRRTEDLRSRRTPPPDATTLSLSPG